VSAGTPGFNFVNKGGQQVVTALNGKFTLKGKITVQTVYGPNASATQISGYGRGTTAEDEAAGNITLGFHESCHRADYFRYLQTRLLPTFTGKVGMTVPQYKQAGQAFQTAYKAYFDQMGAESKASTDEVGYTLTQYRQKGPR
jgi:hypothetical protein